jgi:hypothetical protein
MLLGVLYGCGEVTETPRLDRQLGIIEFYEDPVVVEVPDIASARVPFTIRVVTFGLCIEAWDTEISLVGASATVIPYNYQVQEEGFACPTVLNRVEHVARLQFDSPGTAVVSIRGRRLARTPAGPGGSPNETEITIERRVVVQELGAPIGSAE